MLRVLKSCSSPFFVAAVLVMILAARTTLLHAQGTDLGQIRGSVTDASEAAVPNAKVQVTDVATDQSRITTTNPGGAFEFTNLKSGGYKLTISAGGFDTLVINGVEVVSGSVARVDGRLQVAKSADAITVQSEASAVQTDSPTISSTLDNRDLIEIPRDSRDIYEFLYLNPSITQSANGDGSFKFLGAQSYGASFSLDGQRSNGGVFGEPTSSQPSLETIGELTVMSSSFTAEYAGIANIRVTTKRGGAKYHGSLFYDNKNSALAAWNLADKIGQSNFSPSP